MGTTLSTLFKSTGPSLFLVLQTLGTTFALLDIYVLGLLLLGGVSLLLFGVSILTIGVLHLGVPKYRIYLLIAKALLSMALSVCLYLHYSTQLGLWRWLTGCLFAGLGLTPVLSGSCMRLLVSRLLIIPAALPKPIQNLVFPSDLSTNAREKALNRALKHGWEEIFLMNKDGLQLHGAQFLHPQLYTCPSKDHDSSSRDEKDTSSPENSNSNQEKWAIYFNGNGGFFELTLEMLTEFALLVNCHMMTFNYRGVGKSQGIATSEADLVQDGLILFQHLLARGVHPDNILIYGFSLGGGVGTQVRRVYPTGPIISDRSFATLPHVPISWVHKLPLAPDSFIKRGLEAVLKTLMSSRFLDWTMDSQTAWGELKGMKACVYCHHDDIIPYHQASLYHALKLQTAREGGDEALILSQQKKKHASYRTPELDGLLWRLRKELKPRAVKLKVRVSRSCPSPHNAQLDLIYSPHKKPGAIWKRYSEYITAIDQHEQSHSSRTANQIPRDKLFFRATHLKLPEFFYTNTTTMSTTTSSSSSSSASSFPTSAHPSRYDFTSPATSSAALASLVPEKNTPTIPNTPTTFSLFPDPWVQVLILAREAFENQVSEPKEGSEKEREYKAKSHQHAHAE